MQKHHCAQVSAGLSRRKYSYVISFSSCFFSSSGCSSSDALLIHMVILFFYGDLHY